MFSIKENFSRTCVFQFWRACVVFLIGGLCIGCSNKQEQRHECVFAESLGTKPAELSTQPGIDSDTDAGSAAEWYPLKTVLVHTPGDELLAGIIHPDAALFARTFSTDQARAEHEKYIALLEESGATVIQLADVLLRGTVDEGGNAIVSKELRDLREFARGAVSLEVNDNIEEEVARQQRYMDGVFAAMHPKDMVRVILNRPKIILDKTDINTGYIARYEWRPLMNLYFLRDQLITTSEGVVVGKMNSGQRAAETDILKFALTKLGIPTLLEISGDGRLEGGDFLPAGDVVFIGMGLRTNAEAIEQLLSNGKEVFGGKTVVVVKDSFHDQDEMHLDTFFNIIDGDLAVLLAGRMTIADDGGNVLSVPETAKLLLADIYSYQENTGYSKVKADVGFQEYLENSLKMKVIPVTKQDQQRSGTNFLTVGPRKIIAVDGVSQAYKQVLAQNGVTVRWVDFYNLAGGYGAAHCTTQAIARRK